MRATLLTLGLLAAALPVAGQTLADYDYENLQFRGIGLDFGHLWSERVDNTAMYGIRVDLGYLGPGIRIIPSINYWSSRFTREELDRLAARIRAASGSATPSGEDLDPIRWSDISLSVDGHLVWSTPIHVLTFIGLGLGLHALNGRGDAIQETFVEDLLDSVTAGAAVLAGLEFEPLERFRVYTEGRYTVMSSIQFLTVRGGLQFMFTQGRGIEVGAAVPAPPLASRPPASEASHE